MKKQLKRKSRRRLTGPDVQHVIALIGEWPANKRLTWERIVSMMKLDTGLEWTRQTLEKKDPIRRAYKTHATRYKDFVGSGKLPKRASPEDLVIKQKIERLRTENAELRESLRQSDERLIRYLMNAIRFGVTQEQLESPVPKVVVSSEDE